MQFGVWHTASLQPTAVMWRAVRLLQHPEDVLLCLGTCMLTPDQQGMHQSDSVVHMGHVMSWNHMMMWAGYGVTVVWVSAWGARPYLCAVGFISASLSVHGPGWQLRMEMYAIDRSPVHEQVGDILCRGALLCVWGRAWLHPLRADTRVRG